MPPSWWPPSDPGLRLRLDLAQVRTRFRMGEAVASHRFCGTLAERSGHEQMPVDFQRESRELSGRIHYYAGWVMRLEGASRELWMEEAELARQNFRLLAEQSAAQGDKEYSAKQQENLESAVQLQRLSLTELMARPLPKEGQCMAGRAQRANGQTPRPAWQRQQPGVGEGEGDHPPRVPGMQRFQPGSGS
jgi:hypothetical protein